MLKCNLMIFASQIAVGSIQQKPKVMASEKTSNIQLHSNKKIIKIASQTSKNEQFEKCDRFARNLSSEFDEKCGKCHDFLSHAISLFLDGFSQELVSEVVPGRCFGFYFWFFNAIVR